MLGTQLKQAAEKVGKQVPRRPEETVSHPVSPLCGSGFSHFERGLTSTPNPISPLRG
ncbi:MAG: hypothetical protein WAL85_01360 [Candidatus Korobacteraceae bacterium]